MTDPISTAPVAAPTQTSQPSQVVQEVKIVDRVSNAKPYDDEILNSYSEDADEGAAEDTSATEETPVSTQDKEEELNDESPKKTDEINKATKNDKVEDGIEEISIKRPINGKDVQFKLKDAIQAYVKQEEFNRNMDRRITHISQREQAWNKDQEAFKANLVKLMEVAQAGDFVTAVRGLAKFATHGTQLDPTDFERQYFEQLDKVGEVWTKMSPEQREAHFAKRAAEEARARVKRLEEEKSIEAQKSQLQGKVQTLQREHNIPEDEFWGNYQVLSEELVKRGVVQSPDEIQAEHVVNFTLETRRQELIFEAAKRTGLEDPEKIEELGRVTAIEPNLTVEDMVEIINNGGLVSVAPKAVVENLNKKAGNNKSQFSKASSAKKEERLEGYDKDDVDYLYRKQPKNYSRIILR